MSTIEASAPGASPLSDTAAEVYIQRLLENIYVMLTYANETGKALPEDLRQKIDALFEHPDFQRHASSSSFSGGIAWLWRRS
jgi:hypothetical protein